MELTAGGRVLGVGDLPDRQVLLPALPRRVGQGHRAQQRVGVGVLRVVVDRRGVAPLHQLTQVHDPDLVAHEPAGGQVVGDVDVGQAELVLEVQHQLQDLRADRHVQRGDGRVGDDQLRLGDQRPGDHHALLLSAGDVLGVGVEVALGGGEPAALQHLRDLGADLGPARRQAVDPQRVSHAPHDGHGRVEGGVCVLEDLAHLAAVEVSKLQSSADPQCHASCLLHPLARAAVLQRPGEHGVDHQTAPAGEPQRQELPAPLGVQERPTGQIIGYLGGQRPDDGRPEDLAGLH